MATRTKTCVGCGETFQTTNDSAKCYDCTLDELTRGRAPEEGDFNTAAITSGTLTEAEQGYLAKDLEAIECGRTTQEEAGFDAEGYPIEEDWEDEAEAKATDERNATRWGDAE